MTGFYFQRLAFENVSFGHLPGKNLWDKVNFEFPLGRSVWVRAHLGAGASSLLRMLAGILPPTEGRYWVNGMSFYDERFYKLTQLRQRIGYAFDEGGLISNLTLEANLLLPLRYHGLMSPQESTEKVKFYLGEFGLEDSKDLRPALASSSTRRGCLLARAMILDPEILFLDDPTRGLPLHVVQRVKRLIDWHYSEKKLRSLFVSTEDEEFMKSFGAETVELRNCGIHRVQAKQVAA